MLDPMPPSDSPYIDDSGAMVIPFSADPRYHYWNGGQSMADTLLELNAPENVWKNHTTRDYPGNGS
jgi:hypothetical protein